ncbi:MAG: hypothetical protein R3C68_05460 [Myxococcota bacterium]
MKISQGHLAGEYIQANRLLSKTISVMYGLGDNWELPATVPGDSTATDATPTIEVTPADVAAACPELAKKGKGNAADLVGALERLRRLMNNKSVRLVDLKGGEALFNDLRSYRRYKAYWPAIRVTCALTQKFNDLEIDLGFCMGRFQIVNHLKAERQISGTKRQRFSELVRHASDAIANKEFATAHSRLEELLVLLGKSTLPGSVLDEDT